MATSKAGKVPFNWEDEKPNSESEPEPVQRDPRFYFQDGNVVIKVESTLFKVYRSMLVQHSPVFRDMFMVPQPEPESGGSIEGSNDDNPIVLEGVKSQDFTLLLSYLFPRDFLNPGPGKTDSSGWTSVLIQADRWQVDQLRQLAISRLEMCRLDPITTLELRAKGLLPLGSRLVTNALSTLVKRESPLTLDEAKRLHTETIVEIARVREKRLKDTLSCHKK